jgi:hypothetical protein
MLSGLGSPAECSWLGLGSPATFELAGSSLPEALPVAIRPMPALTIARQGSLVAAGHGAQAT